MTRYDGARTEVLFMCFSGVLFFIKRPVKILNDFRMRVSRWLVFLFFCFCMLWGAQ